MNKTKTLCKLPLIKVRLYLLGSQESPVIVTIFKYYDYVACNTVSTARMQNIGCR